MIALVFLVAGSSADTHAQSPTTQPQPTPQPAHTADQPSKSNLPPHTYVDPLEDPIVMRPQSTPADAHQADKSEPVPVPCTGKKCPKIKTPQETPKQRPDTN